MLGPTGPRRRSFRPEGASWASVIASSRAGGGRGPAAPPGDVSPRVGQGGQPVDADPADQQPFLAAGRELLAPVGEPAVAELDRLAAGLRVQLEAQVAVVAAAAL